MSSWTPLYQAHNASMEFACSAGNETEVVVLTRAQKALGKSSAHPSSFVHMAAKLQPLSGQLMGS